MPELSPYAQGYRASSRAPRKRARPDPVLAGRDRASRKLARTRLQSPLFPLDDAAALDAAPASPGRAPCAGLSRALEALPTCLRTSGLPGHHGQAPLSNHCRARQAKQAAGVMLRTASASTWCPRTVCLALKGRLGQRRDSRSTSWLWARLGGLRDVAENSTAAGSSPRRQLTPVPAAWRRARLITGRPVYATTTLGRRGLGLFNAGLPTRGLRGRPREGAPMMNGPALRRLLLRPVQRSDAAHPKSPPGRMRKRESRAGVSSGAKSRTTQAGVPSRA